MLSVVIPSYNEEENILNTAEVIAGVLVGAKIDYELIFVDDGSKDSTWDKIEKAHEINLKSRGVRLSRNFGKEGAIFAGVNGRLLLRYRLRFAASAAGDTQNV